MTKILYFGRLTDLTGTSEEQIQFPSNLETAGQLQTWLDDRFETSGALTDQTIRIAINGEIILDSTPLNGAHEIAFMPPVGGG